MSFEKNLTIIGTSHISRDSVNEVKEFILKNKPDIIAVELDRDRLHQLFSKEKDKFSIIGAFRLGFAGFFFAIIGRYAQKKLGDFVGIKPGSDMKSAVALAKKNKIQLALIDQHINITLQRFSSVFGMRDLFAIGKELFMAMFKKEPKIQFDLTKVPSSEVINQLLIEVKKKYPKLYKVLVEERNVVMANNLKMIMTKDPDKKILAVVGAGHVDGMKKLLSNEKFSYSFSFSY